MVTVIGISYPRAIHPEMDASRIMHGGFPPEEPLSTMEQMLLLGSALFCALLWRCLARSMDRRAREREERKRRSSLPIIGSFGLRTRSTNDSFQQPQSKSVLQRCSSDAVNVPRMRRVSEDRQRSPRFPTEGTLWKSANNLRGSIPLSARRAGLQLMFDRLDTLERRRGGGSL